MSDQGNAATARRFFELLGRGDIDAWGDPWADGGRIIVCYPPEGFDSVIEGRPAILSAFRGLFANYAVFESDITAIYPAADSDAVCVEYTDHAKLLDGTDYTNDNIAVFRFRDGLITAYHDYFDPRRFQVVVDALARATGST